MISSVPRQLAEELTRAAAQGNYHEVVEVVRPVGRVTLTMPRTSAVLQPGGEASRVVWRVGDMRR